MLQTVQFKKIVDLSQRLYPGMPSWPTDPQLKYEQVKTTKRDSYALTLISQMTTHTGTHLDAPAHFILDGKTVDKIPLDRYYGNGVVLELNHKKAGEEITLNDLREYDGQIKADEIIFLHTGWDKKEGFSQEYLYMWPHLALESASYLASRKVKAVGIDALSIGGWSDSTPGHPALARTSSADLHKALLGKAILVVELLANLDKVLEGKRVAKAFFVFTPLNLTGAEAGPCRAIALV